LPFWNFINKAATETEPESVELRVEGEIVDDNDAWFYDWIGEKATSPNAFKAELAAHAGKPITMWLDSPGGNVFAATGMYTALQEHKAKGGKVTAKVIKSHSAATILQMAGDEIMMTPAGTVFIHDPMSGAQGYAKDLRKVADMLDVVKEAIMNAYQLKTGKSRAKLSEMMDNETLMDARAAIKEGFATGMLYSEPKAAEAEMVFTRHSFANTTAESVKRIVALCKEKDPTPAPPPDTSKPKALLALEIEI
jgi:ATP-dependent Clp protease protease subunit